MSVEPVHHCHARGCSVECPPELLMCPRHWKLVPGLLRAAVHATYRPGQCDDKNPSRAWHKAATMAIDYVARVELLSPSLESIDP